MSAQTCTPLSHMARYVDCYRVALQHRTRAVEALLQAFRREDEAKLLLDCLVAGKQPPPPSSSSSSSSSRNSNNGDDYLKDSRRIYSDIEIKEDSIDNSAIFVENASSRRKDNGSGGGKEAGEPQWILQRKAEAQEQLNLAKLKLVEEEDNVERMKKEEIKLTKRLKKESKLMEDKGRAILLVRKRYLTNYDTTAEFTTILE